MVNKGSHSIVHENTEKEILLLKMYISIAASSMLGAYASQFRPLDALLMIQIQENNSMNGMNRLTAGVAGLLHICP
jgi:hypothetical protein